MLETEIEGRDDEALVSRPQRNESPDQRCSSAAVFDAAVKTVRAAADAPRQQEKEETKKARTPKFPAITPHDLRHACASLAIKGGANVALLQNLLGHKTATLTLDRYGHLFPDDLDRIADAFDEAVSQQNFAIPTQSLEPTADCLRTGRPLHVLPESENAS